MPRDRGVEVAMRSQRGPPPALDDEDEEADDAEEEEEAVEYTCVTIWVTKTRRTLLGV